MNRNAHHHVPHLRLPQKPNENFSRWDYSQRRQSFAHTRCIPPCLCRKTITITTEQIPWYDVNFASRISKWLNFVIPNLNNNRRGEWDSLLPSVLDTRHRIQCIRPQMGLLWKYRIHMQSAFWPLLTTKWYSWMTIYPDPYRMHVS